MVWIGSGSDGSACVLRSLLQRLTRAHGEPGDGRESGGADGSQAAPRLAALPGGDQPAVVSPDHPPVDGRAHPRSSAPMLVRLPTRQGDLWHFVVDVGAGGLAFGSLHPVPVGTTLGGVLADPESGETHGFTGRIVWYDPLRARSGVEFVESDAGLSDLLSRVICDS